MAGDFLDAVIRENPELAKTIMRFMVLYDASDLLTELKPPQHDSVVAYLKGIANALLIQQGLPEGFAEAMIAGRPPLDVARVADEPGKDD